MKSFPKSLAARVIASAFACSICIVSFGQVPVSKPSPDSYATIDRIQNPVDYNTGIININIPLYNVSCGNINVPVSLGYKASGIRLEDQPGGIAMGWLLSCGGKITRVVKQKPDIEYPLATNILYGSFFNNVGIYYVDYKELNSEHDLFFFEIPGRSGMFILDENGNAITIPYQKIKIERYVKYVANSYSYDGFVITNENGTKYYFGDILTNSRETTTIKYKNYNLTQKLGIAYLNKEQEETFSYVSTWHLSEIRSYTGNNVKFSYQDLKTPTTRTENSIFNFCYNSNGFFKADGNFKATPINAANDSNFEPQTTYSESTTSTKTIKNISWRGGVINFIMNYSSEYLSDIEIYNQNSLIKSFRLWFTIASSRRLLDAISENASKAYSFSYNTSVTMPKSTSYDFDSWGYYNYSGNTVNRSQLNGTEVGLIPGAKRSPNLNGTLALTLTSITNLTGGRTEYYYELNQDDKGPVGGLRVKEIRQVLAEGSTSSIKYEYLKPDRTSSGKTQHKPVYGYSNGRIYSNNQTYISFVTSSKPMNDIYDFGGKQISYTRVTETLPDGSSTAYEYTSEDDDPWWLDYSLYGDYPSVYFFSNDITSPTNNGLFEDLFYPNSSRFWRRGLLKCVTKLDAVGSTVSKREYQYKFGDTRAAIFGYIPGTKLNFPSDRKDYFYLRYFWESQQVMLDKTIDRETNKNTYLETQYVFNNRACLDKIIYKDDERYPNITEVRFKYPFSYEFGNINLLEDRTGIYILKHDSIISPIEILTYKNGKLIDAKLTLYNTIINAVGSSPNPIPGQPDAVEFKTLALPKYEYSVPLIEPLSNFEETPMNQGINFIMDKRYKLMSTIDSYDEYGNPQSITSSLGHIKSKIYGYNDLYVIAEIENALYAKDQKNSSSYGTEYNEVFYTSFEEMESDANIVQNAKSGEKVLVTSSYIIDFSRFKTGRYIITYWTRPVNSTGEWKRNMNYVNITADTFQSYTLNLSGNCELDEVRVIPVNAEITTYAYKPGIGVISVTDNLGNSIYYEYDKLGRLAKVMDNERNIIQMKEYNFILK